MAFVDNRIVTLGHLTREKCLVRDSQPVEIVEPLTNDIVEESSNAVLECKVKGYPEATTSWFKDGKKIVSSNRITTTVSGKWHRLQIKSVVPSDYGVYTVICENNLNKAFSGATLHVKLKSDDDTVYTDPCPRKSLSVIKQLLPIRVHVGDIIELNAEFQSNAISNHVWYKSNEQIISNERLIILSENNTSTLHIKSAQVTDSGVYFVIIKTKYGVSSSFTDVCVADVSDKPIKHFIEEVPIILEHLSCEIETNEKEEVKLVCKAVFDSNTKIQWLKNNIPIHEDRLIPEQHCMQNIALRIMEPRLNDAGEYSVILQNKNRYESSKCYLTVNPCPMKKPPIIQKGKLLNSVIASVGSKATFECSFIISDPKYFYVVWYVGNSRVERTNSRFEVLYNGGSYLLYIKQLEPSMAGEVICELRRGLPNRRSILINSTSANLTVVPPYMLAEKTDLPISRFRKKVYHEKYMVYLKNYTNDIQRHRHMSIEDFNGNKCAEHGLAEKVLLEFTYCRLEDRGFFYLDVTYGEQDIRITAFDRLSQSTEALNWNQLECIIVEWDECIQKPRMWYGVDLLNKNGEYVEVGVSSLAMFEIKTPFIGKIMKFRIRTVVPIENASESTVCVIPQSREPTSDPKKYELKSVELFEETYTKTGDMIGCGAFGSVILVRNSTGEYFAAKMLKTRTQKKRDTALRECEIMTKLCHPKLVELKDTFVSKDTFVLVMDYLWGGELFDRIVEEDHIKEIDVVPYVRQICEALLYLHELKIAHLDLKPENIICLSPNSRQIKIIDFGLARVLKEGQATRAIYGTREYVAPEVLNFEVLTLACDMWSLGVVTYTLLSGVMPFAGDSWPERSANITMANYNYDDIVFREISDSAKNFVDHLLIIRADKRMSASEALNHQWIVEGPPMGARAGYMKRAKENLKTYLANYRARWQRAGNVMIAAHRFRTYAGNTRCGDITYTTSQTISPQIT